MKKYILTGLLSIAAFGFSASAQVKTSAQEVATPELAEKRELLKKQVIANYLGMKNSLVLSDEKKTAAYAKEFSNSLTLFKFKKLTLEEMNIATVARQSIKALADSIIAAPSINEQRKLMEKLSTQFWANIEKYKPANTALYQQRCPMMGTTWVSDEKKIANPYYPKNMLTCGEVIAEK